jgi:acid phosphatase family membrane protein YuiD
MQGSLWQEILGMLVHPTFWVTGCAWLAACFLKVMILRFQTGMFYWDRFFGTGGMPSSHTAFAAALTMCVGVSEGFNSAVCGLSLGWTILTAVDAVGLRRAAGRQAQLLNKISSDIYASKKAKPPRLRETLGHSLFEVLAGAFVGASIAFLLYPQHH